MVNKNHKVLKFSATWCGPCKALAPVFKDVVTTLGIPVVELDADKNEKEFDKYSVRAVPTIILLDGETEIRRTSGLMSREKLTSFLTVSEII